MGFFSVLLSYGAASYTLTAVSLVLIGFFTFIATAYIVSELPKFLIRFVLVGSCVQWF